MFTLRLRGRWPLGASVNIHQRPGLPLALAVLFLGVFPNHGPLWLIGEVPVLDWA